MKRPQFIESQIIEKAEELFEDYVLADDLLKSWFRGHLSSAEVIERLRKHKLDAEQFAHGALEDEHEEEAVEIVGDGWS